MTRTVIPCCAALCEDARASFLRWWTVRRLLWYLVLLARPVRSQDQNTQSAPLAINTDRPAFADSSVVVPKYSFQVENGVLATPVAHEQSFDFPETLLRFGVAEKTELRFTVPDYYENLYPGTSAGSGWNDLSVGLKEQLGPIRGFDVSLGVSLSLPTGSRLISSGGYDPSIQLPWSRKLSANWTAAGMLSVYWPTQSSSQQKRRNTTGQATILVDRQLTKPWDGFVEYVGDFPQRGGPEHILHVGTAYKTTARQQVDFHFGFGMSSAAPDHFVGIGYSFLFGQLRQRS